MQLLKESGHDFMSGIALIFAQKITTFLVRILIKLKDLRPNTNPRGTAHVFQLIPLRFSVLLFDTVQ